MTKRIFSLFLAAAMLMGLLLIRPVQAEAATMVTSDQGIAVLKNMEGFRQYPYSDGDQYYVGYGSGCPSADLARYQKDGITEKEADELLHVYLDKMEEALNKFASKNSLSLTQTEFDALMLFTYNVGSAWMNETSDFRTAVLNGTRGNDFIYYMTRWCVSGGVINEGLIKRRLAEADMYLNGNYSASGPSYYSYVLLDANGGSRESGVQGYDAGDTAKVRINATRSGYKFLGWYTEKEGGRLITDLDTTTAKKTLYAHWQSSSSQGEAANYQRTVTADTSIYKLDGSGSVVGTLKAGQSVTITRDYIDGNGIHWGEMSQGWIDISKTAQPLSKASKPNKVGVSVTVTNSYVNVRSGPGTSYTLVGKVYQGDTLLITETATVNKALWGKFSGGWLSLQYTNYNQVNSGNASGNAGSSTGTVIATGTVVDCSTLRIRSGPGTSYSQVGSLNAGAYVEITQRQTTNGAEWGKISKGWICLTYVKLVEKKPEAAQKPETEQKPSGDTSTGTGSGNVGTKTGTVINCQQLNVRSGPGTHNAKVATLARGAKVEILETTVYKNERWGRIEQGWIHMGYIQLDYTSSDMGSTGEGVKGTVYNCTKLNVRKAPGTNNTPVGYLLPGNVVTIYEETTVGDMHWGRMDQGWVCMDYIKLESGTAADGVPENKVEGSRTGVVINTNALRVRSGAGTAYAHIGTLNMGTVVIIYEQTTINGVGWGRIDQGWVCMNYIRLDPEDGSFEGIINTNGLTIHATAGSGDSGIGTYNGGEVVKILETTTVNGVSWGRTDRGWICLQYVVR